MTEAEKLDAACVAYEQLCKLKAKPTAIIFRRYFACKPDEAEKLLKYAESKSLNPRRWCGRNLSPGQVGKFAENDAEMLFWAFRYCLGRRTYAVSDFCDYATAHITQFRTKELNLMVREITEYEQRDAEDDTEFKWLGDECDRRDWLKFRECCKSELRKRGKLQ